MPTAHMTPLQRFALLSRWRRTLADDLHADIECIPSGWAGYEGCPNHCDSVWAGDCRDCNYGRGLAANDAFPRRAGATAVWIVVLVMAIAAACCVAHVVTRLGS